MKPIETRAYGYRFRSRLEARWAVFFQTLGLQWEYEPEGFDLGGELYLPDFRVTTGDLVYWYEIKPRVWVGDKGKSIKFDLFRAQLDKEANPNVEARLVTGDPLDNFSYSERYCPRCGRPTNVDYVSGPCAPHTPSGSGSLLDLLGLNCLMGFLCDPCDHNTPSGSGNPEKAGFAGVNYWPEKGSIMISMSGYELMIEKLHTAAEIARSARFEHGEQP